MKKKTYERMKTVMKGKRKMRKEKKKRKEFSRVGLILKYIYHNRLFNVKYGLYIYK